MSSLPPVVVEPETATSAPSAGSLVDQLAAFRWEGRPTAVTTLTAAGVTVPVFANEFWTSRQRAASRLHEVSYRACFKPQLPAFFISRLTAPGDVVYDPFMGRGTTVLEAALLGRVPRGCDVNPLSHVLALPRLAPPTLDAVAARLASIDLAWPGPLPADLLVFFHPDTLREILALRACLLARESSAALDAVRSVDAHGGGQPPDRSLTGVLLRHRAPNQAASAARSGRSTPAAIRCRHGVTCAG